MNQDRQAKLRKGLKKSSELVLRKVTNSKFQAFFMIKLSAERRADQLYIQKLKSEQLSKLEAIQRK